MLMSILLTTIGLVIMKMNGTTRWVTTYTVKVALGLILRTPKLSKKKLAAAQVFILIMLALYLLGRLGHIQRQFWQKLATRRDGRR